MSWLSRVFPLVPVAGLLALGCASPPCDAAVRSGLSILVVDGGGESQGQGGLVGSTECAAVVTISTRDSIGCYTDGDDCRCITGYLAGPMVVTVELDGKREAKRVTLEEDECHVIMQELCFGDCATPDGQ